MERKNLPVNAFRFVRPAFPMMFLPQLHRLINRQRRRHRLTPLFVQRVIALDAASLCGMALRPWLPRQCAGEGWRAMHRLGALEQYPAVSDVFVTAFRHVPVVGGL